MRSLLFAILFMHTLPLYAEELETTEQAVTTIEASNELVTVKELKVLGAGVVNKKTNETIALACYNETCEEFRNVYTSADHSVAYWIGPIFTLTDQGYKKTIKTYKKEYRAFVKRWHRNTSSLLGMTTLGGGMITSCVLVATGLATAGVGVMIMGTAVFANIIIGQYNLQLGTSYTSEQGMWSSFTDKGGWSWSIDFKRVSERAFNDYFLFNTEFHSGPLERLK